MSKENTIFPKGTMFFISLIYSQMLSRAQDKKKTYFAPTTSSNVF